MREPLIHSHIIDCLLDDHPLAYTSLNCRVCGAQVHAANNECMQTWVEAKPGNYCLKCFADCYGDVLEDEVGLDG